MKPSPAWAKHRQPGSEIPLDTQAARRYLRRGHLVEILLHGGSEPALIAGDRQFSHDQLKAEANERAAVLRSNGLEQGTHVALMAENSADWIITYLSLQSLDATVIPMNPGYKQAEAEHILHDSGARFLIKNPSEDSVAPLQLAGSLPLVGRDREGVPRTALIMYTSGTTGRPKGAMLDDGNMLAQARGVVEAWRWTSRDRLVLALPLFHLHGLGVGLHGSLISGGCAVLVPFSPENVVRELTDGGTMFFGVPAMYQRICDYLEQHPADLSHVRLFVSGSAPLSPSLFERCRRLLGQPVLERYGLTEGGIVVSNPYDGPRLAGRVGYPLPGVEIRLGDGGEVQLKGGQVFCGYWRNQAATTEAFVDGWLRTGDIGEIDVDGSLAIRGRIKELIITGGLNVYPREVEMVLEQHPAVAEAAVVGVPSEQWGEEVTAYVAKRGAIDPDELIAFARERLATYKCPRAIRFIDALPRNAMGKIDRASLQ